MEPMKSQRTFRFVRGVKFADVFLGSDSGSTITNLEAHQATGITKMMEMKGVKRSEKFLSILPNILTLCYQPKVKILVLKKSTFSISGSSGSRSLKPFSIIF